MTENHLNTILYLDDEIINLEVFETTFEDDFNILLANNAQEAMELLHKNNVKVVLTDQRMPDVTGIEFIEIAAEKFPDCVYIILSAYTDFEIAKKAIASGHVERFLLKPWNVEEVKMEVDKAIEKHELIIKNKKLIENLEKQNQELIGLKTKLSDELVYLKEEIKLEHNFDEIISHDKEFTKVLSKVEQVATTDSTVLILGETGTGKELIARAIHNLSNLKERAFVRINCATIPADLIESELFGHEKGAFTGAIKQKKGKFELANNGTIFLDEIGELPLELQPKLLRALQEGEIERLGGNETINISIRVIAATNRNLLEEVENNKFRSDLYYRLNVFPVLLPPLRERKLDIPYLVKHFTDFYSNKYGKNISEISQTSLKKMQKYPWPGNIRELENIVERAVILSTSKKLNIEEVLPQIKPHIGKSEVVRLDEVEKQHIIKVLEKTSWKIGGENGAAELLGLNRTTLNSRMQKLGIKRPS